MARKKNITQKEALRQMVNSYLKENNVKSEDGMAVNSIMLDMMAIVL